MAESSRRLRKSTSTGIAATSAIALALGGLSVVAPGPLAPHAVAATMSGGIREKSGAVEKDAQKASDLPAGSCVIESVEPDGSQAGFSWNTLEPSGSSPSKTRWGLSVSFDNSKDRTFADWSFTNSGLMGGYLDAAQIPAMDAGLTLVDKVVTHKADETLVIDGSGRQRNLNLVAKLTDAKVKQFAEATAANPVRYAWQGDYKQENPKGPRATQGGSVLFTAVVNPWPSENIECNPITVSWDTPDVSENHVIVPGEVSKVGKINVPAVTGGGTDDSMSRMVVEAYDGNGKFIGTTDPAASGGEQLLRIDSKTGDIYFTWPEYRGTDLATDKNVNFSVLAKPRNVDQLQAAGENNNEFGTTQVFDSSNSLTRYNKANVIGSQAFSLDNTDEHNPRYDKVDATIISGVDSATGPLATEPQRVTFTQTPDLIKELAKKKGDGGFEAKVALDKTYVYEGWTVEMDEDYNVTVTAPENPKPGTFAQPKITLEYSNGSTDVLQLLVVVDPNNTQVTDLVRPGLTKGKIGEDLTAQVGTKSIMKGHKPVHPAKFEVDPDTVPSGWTVTVDATGKVTAKADDSVAPGTVITPKVKATYPDGTDDEIETQFQAIVDIKVPEYDTVTNKPNAKVSLIPNVPERGLSGNTSDEVPKRYTFENGQTTITLTSKEGKTWTVKIDENTGKITTTIPKDAPEGDILDVPVLAYYDGADPQKVKGTVVVIKGDVAPQYNVQVTGPNQAVDHQVTGAPQDSTYSFGNDEDGNPVTEQEVDGWKYTIDPKTGVVSSTPPATAKPGDKKTITVTVQTPDGSRPEVPVTTVVKHTNSWEAEPVYPVETVYPGEAATLPVDLQKPEDVNVAKENPYKLGDVPAGWNVSIDDNGQITATAPADAKPGTQVKIPVTVTYEDGSTDIAYAVVNVLGLPTREVPFNVEYKYDDSIPAGEYKVETKGKPGAEKMHKDGTWERTTEPTNEVVVIGTKPAESAKDVTWTAPTPFETELRENPELKPGEVKVVQEGVPGEKTYTAKFTSKGDEATVTPEEKETKTPVKQIIEYGPGVAPSELVTTVKKPVPFETEVVFDDTLAAGEQKVDQAGKLGEDTVTSTQKLVDGKPSGDPVVKTERTAEPTKQIIRVGTKTAGETKKTVESEVPFGVKIEYDPNMPAGKSEVVTEGKPGKKTTTVTQKVTNSQPDSEATVEEKVTEQPVDQVIKVGTKPSETSEKVEWKAPVPFEVETRPNKDLKPGEIKVVQKGEPGEKTYTANFTSKGDDSSVKPEEKQTKDPVKEIIEYGPTTPDQTLTSTKTREVNYETEFIVDNTVPVGQTKVEQEGEKGEELITSTQKIKDGKPDGEPNITVEQTKAPKKKIVRVGSMTNGTYELEEKLPIPFDTVVEYDPEIPAGEYKIVTKGQPGEKTTKITQTIENSKVVDAKRGETTNSEPVTEVIKVGTKQATASDKVEWKEPIPYPTELRPNLNLAPGEVRVVQQGKDGEATFTATFTGTNGEAAKTEETARTEPTPRIVEFGPGLEDDSVVSKTTRLVEFETEIVEDPNLEEGKQVIEQGEFGEEVVTSTQKLVDGKPSGEPVVKTERTKEPKKAIIRVGTKKPANPTPPTDEPEQPTPPTDEPGPSIDPKEVELPYTTKIIYDETLEPGQEIVDQEGANGKVEVTVEKGQPSVKVVKEPVEKIIRVGTKPPADIEWNERIPFEVKVKLDPTIEAGKHKVEQEGKPGLVHHKSDGTEETVVEKQDHVILIGTKKPGNDPENPEQPEQPTPGGDLEIKVRYTTRIVYDPNLKPGEEVEDVAGKDGRYTIKVVDGKPVAEMVEKPVERVLRVGTKPPAGVRWTEEISYDYEVVEDSELEAGKHQVVQPGKPGQRIHKEDGSVVEVAPQKLIIKVGTKKSPTDPTDPSKPTEPSTPAEPGANGSSEKAKRCAANAFAVNSPLLWLLPIGLLAGIGYGVNEAFGPQLQQAGAELNARFQESMPKRDWGHGQQGRRHEDPEWVRELRAKADSVNRQFAGYGEQLRPLGIALGAIAAVSMLGVLIAQACEEDGFNNGLTILGSSKGDTPADKAKAGSSEQK